LRDLCICLWLLLHTNVSSASHSTYTLHLFLHRRSFQLWIDVLRAAIEEKALEAVIGVRETERARLAAAEAARATDMAAEWRGRRYESVQQGLWEREAQRELRRGEDVETPNHGQALIG
jgi:hypothetical protein